jgi:very-short-patch-repair endonuclease
MTQKSPSTNTGCLTQILRIFGLAPRSAELPYRVRDDFLSPAEASFLHVLQNMIGDKMLIYPQVSLAALFYVSQRQNWQAFQNKIDRKRVDFLLCDPKTFKPIFAIELDDSSHARPDRVERDDFVNEVFRAAGLPLVRVKAQTTYNTTELMLQIQNALYPARQPAAAPAPKTAATPTPAKTDGQPPNCPKCGVPMVIRTAQKGDRVGRQFYGCPNYPQCRVTLPVSDTQST